CELDPRGPLYLLPTRELIGALASRIHACGAKRVLEVAGGDGFLSAALRQAAPGLEVIASDSGAWTDPRARMTARERREFRGINVPGVRLGASVLRLDALAAIRRTRPDLVLASWLPPGALLERLVRAPVRYVLEIGAKDGVTPGAYFDAVVAAGAGVSLTGAAGAVAGVERSGRSMSSCTVQNHCLPPGCDPGSK